MKIPMEQNSDRLTRLLARAHITDMTAPGVPGYIYSEDEFEKYVNTFVKAGFRWVSFTAENDATCSVERGICSLATARRFFFERSDRFLLAHSVADIRRAKFEQKVAVSFHFQGTNPTAGKLELLNVYKALGVGHMLIAYNIRNFLGDGCYETENAGLSIFGRRFVEEMNRVGIAVDCAHTGHRSSMNVCEIASKPVIISHSNPKGLYKHPRNIEDSLIRACAETGGVIGCNGVGMFMSSDASNNSTELLFRQIDYIVQLVGPEHAAMGLDYVQNIEALVGKSKGILKMFGEDTSYQQDHRNYGFVEPGAVSELCELMLAAGYSDEDTLRILGENWLNVYEQIWGK